MIEKKIDGICCKKNSQNKSSLLNMVQCVYKYTEDSSCQSLYLSTRRENINVLLVNENNNQHTLKFFLTRDFI